MKRVLFLIFSSLLILDACGQVGDNSIKNDNKKSNAPKRNKDSDAKSENQSSKNKSRTYTAQQYNALVDDYNTMINKPESKSKVSNSVSQSKYNTLLKEYNALVDEAYEENGY